MANLASRISKVHVAPQKPFALPPTNSGKPHPCCTFDPTQSIKWNIDRQERLRKACKKKDWLRNHLIRALYTAYYIYPYDINPKVFLKENWRLSKNAPTDGIRMANHITTP